MLFVSAGSFIRSSLKTMSMASQVAFFSLAASASSASTCLSKSLSSRSHWSRRCCSSSVSSLGGGGGFLLLRVLGGIPQVLARPWGAVLAGPGGAQGLGAGSFFHLSTRLCQYLEESFLGKVPMILCCIWT